MGEQAGRDLGIGLSDYIAELSSPYNVTVAAGATLGGTGAIGGVVAMQSGDLLAPGTHSDTFTLFSASGYSGNFAAINLPSLPAGLAWAWTPANGTLVVVNAISKGRGAGGSRRLAA
jgi:hypothetical protein